MDTFKWTSKESETTFLGATSKSKIVVSVHCAYASKDKMIRTVSAPNGTKIIFFISALKKVAYLMKLYGIKISRI
jgi:hypothetical protein